MNFEKGTGGEKETIELLKTIRGAEQPFKSGPPYTFATRMFFSSTRKEKKSFGLGHPIPPLQHVLC